MGLHEITKASLCLLAGALLTFPSLHAEICIQPESLQEPCRSSIIPNRVLYLIQQGHIGSALQLYQEHCDTIGGHDFDLLQHMGLVILDQGFSCKEPEIQVMTIFGAGISNNDRALYILEDGILSNIPQVQLVSMNMLAKFQNDYADHALNHCLRSNNLLIRLEAAFHLCNKKHPKAVGQTESLMAKVDPILHPLFPQLFALAGTDSAIKILKKLMANPNEDVRVAAVLSATKHRRDDLLPQIRILSSHHHVSQQEICAIALGELGDDSSIEQLRRMTGSTTPSVRLAALQALYRLDCSEAKPVIESAAREGYLPAIFALGEIKGSEGVLVELIQDSDINVRINAALALLELRDARALRPLCEVLVKDRRDLALVKGYTLGKGLPVWKVMASASQHCQENPVIYELSLHSLETILAKAIDLPEQYFLELCHLLLKTRQNRLVPTVVTLLERLHTPEAIRLLKTHQQQTGAPLIRNYCNLALYRIGEEGPYEESLRRWVQHEQKNDMIRFRPYVPWEVRDLDATSGYQLTPEETSRLLVESFETLAQRQDDNGVEVLLEAIKLGNNNNRYALAGLLIRAAQ